MPLKKGRKNLNFRIAAPVILQQIKATFPRFDRSPQNVTLSWPRPNSSRAAGKKEGKKSKKEKKGTFSLELLTEAILFAHIFWQKKTTNKMRIENERNLKKKQKKSRETAPVI